MKCSSCSTKARVMLMSWVPPLLLVLDTVATGSEE